MPDDWSSEQLKQLSDTFVSKDKYEGHPSSGGLPVLLVWATQEELSGALHAVPGALYVEMDSPLHAAADTVLNENTVGNKTFEGRRCEQDKASPASGAPWGLDRIDGSLDSRYMASGPDGGRGVHIYVMSTGIKTTHGQFAGRAIPTIEATDQSYVKVCQATDINCAADKNGHGTRAASVAGGATVGVAQGAWLHSVKITNDAGVGSVASFLIAADWIMVNQEKPAVMLAPVHGTQAESRVLKDVLDQVAASNIPVVVPAGNDAVNACGTSPAYVPSAVTVGATDINDEIASFSNFGSCVDLFAPGSEILAADIGSDTSYSVVSSTSVAAGQVAGAAAELLSTWSSLKASEVQNQLTIGSYKDSIKDAKTSPNKVLGITWLALQQVNIGASDLPVDGSSKSRKKCVDAPPSVPGELRCAKNAGDPGHRLGEDRFKDSFEITVEGDKVCATRTDDIEDDFLPSKQHPSSACGIDDAGWTLNLQIQCQVRHVEKQDSWLFGRMGETEPSVCAGDNFLDRKSLYYEEYTGISTTDDCISLCKAQGSCTGFSLTDKGTCEVWLKKIGSVARPPASYEPTGEISCSRFLGRGTPGSGIIRLASAPTLCMSMQKATAVPVLENCDPKNERQQFSWTGAGLFHVGKATGKDCLMASGTSVSTAECAAEAADQIFAFEGNGVISQSGGNSNQCLKASFLTAGARVALAECDKSEPRMQFFY